MFRRSLVPSYRLHKQSGQAVVTLPDGLGSRRDVLLGTYGTAESRAEYRRVLAEWEANGMRQPAQSQSGSNRSINELLLSYWHFAQGYYVKNGKPTSQQDRIRMAIKPVREMYGHTLAKDFGPLALRAVQDQMVKLGWSRGYVNQCVGCVKRVWKWGVANELVPGAVFHALQCVPGLKKGRTAARECPPIGPAPEASIEAVLPHLTPHVRGMVLVQWAAAMRPCEVVIMRPCDIDTTGAVWAYTPESHKTEHHGGRRVIYLGPKAQAAIRPFLFAPPLATTTAEALLEPGSGSMPAHIYQLNESGCRRRDPEAYLFSPREAAEGYLRQNERCVRYARKRKPGDCYLVTSYERAIVNACRRVGVPRFTPNQLRHTAATAIRREAGLDAARAVLGHRSPAITEVYAELDMGKAIDVAAKLG